MSAKQFHTLSLRKKTALLFGFGLLGIIAGCLFVTRAFFLYSLDELENQGIAKDSHQASAIINQMIETQAQHAYDWAYWDETYLLFIDGHIDNYWRRNVRADTLDMLGLDLMTFITRQGEILGSESRQQPQQQETVSQEILASPCIQDHLLKMRNTPDAQRTSQTGLIRIGQQIWVISLTPVRNSEATSEMSGWLLWGQHLSRRFPNDYRAILSADNHIQPEAEAYLASMPEGILIKKDSDFITQYKLLHDIDGFPVATLITKKARQFYQQGNTLFYYLTLAILCAASLVALVTYYLFRNNIAARFTDFEQNIETLFSEWQLEKDSVRKKDEFERITALVREAARSSSMAQDQLQDAMQKFEALYQNSSLGMMLVVDGQIQDVNSATLSMLAYRKEQLAGQTFETIWDNQHSTLKLETICHQLHQEQQQFEAVLLTGDGRQVPCGIEGRLIKQQGRSALMLSITDMRTQKEQAKLIEDLAVKDAQSGLLNRPTVMQLIEEKSAAAPQQFAILYFSIERLKQVASVYGYPAFDAAIQYLAALFTEQFQNAAIGRLSESEFVILLDTTTDLNKKLKKANRLIDQLRSPVETDSYQLHLSLKAAFIEPGLTHYSLEHLLQAAYYATHASSQQSNHHLSTIDEYAAEQARIALIISRDLNSAIRQKEIQPHYQPIVAAQSGEIIGFEALARWSHPTLGPVSPAVFIPLAEKHKLIIELGELILEQACQFCHELTQQADAQGQKPLSMHVNLAAPHFYHAELTTKLRTLIAQYELSDHQLVIELTESMLIDAEAEMTERMQSIKALGVQLALDDFGTGYSSFTTLCNYPLDIVKLDRSYINQLTHNDKASTLIRNIARMANELGLTTVAEGVETKAQLDQLNTWQINEIQGFYFYRPMPKTEIVRLLQLNTDAVLPASEPTP